MDAICKSTADAAVAATPHINPTKIFFIPTSSNKTFPEIIPLTSPSVQATLCMNKRMRGA